MARSGRFYSGEKQCNERSGRRNDRPPARARTTEEWPAIRKRPSLPRSLPLRLSIPDFLPSFPFPSSPPSPSFCPLPMSSLPKGCEGGREEPECRLPRPAAPPTDQITNKTNFLAAPRTDAPFVVAAAVPSCRRGCEMGPICGLRLRGSRPSSLPPSLPRPLVILILCKEKGTQYGSVSAEGKRGAIRCSKVGLGVGYR